MMEVTENPNCVRIFKMENIDPPTYPAEYREMTIVLRPVRGPNVAMNPTQAQPIILKVMMAAIVC